jgi:hypothetical protein
MRVLTNMQVSIRGVHVRVEDARMGFSFGITVEKVVVNGGDR